MLVVVEIYGTDDDDDDDDTLLGEDAGDADGRRTR